MWSGHDIQRSPLVCSTLATALQEISYVILKLDPDSSCPTLGIVMKHVALRLALLVALAFVAFSAVPMSPASAATREPTPIVRQWQPAPAREAGGSERRVEDPIFWTIIGGLAGGLIFSGLYLLKRKVGGFPEHPTWVAPISVMPSRELPESFGEAPPDSHGSHH